VVVGCVLPDGGSEASCWVDVDCGSGSDEGWIPVDPESELEAGGKDGVRVVRWAAWER
jgi:hypothetical protein